MANWQKGFIESIIIKIYFLAIHSSNLPKC
jgi:hypothetical protein